MDTQELFSRRRIKLSEFVPKDFGDFVIVTGLVWDTRCVPIPNRWCAYFPPDRHYTQWRGVMDSFVAIRISDSKVLYSQSIDAIRAFYQATEGKRVALVRFDDYNPEDGTVVITPYTREELGIALEHNLEVR